MARATKTRISSKILPDAENRGSRIQTTNKLMLSHRVYGDYPEILCEYFRSQIAELYRELEGLTIFENAFEIRATCKKIIVIRTRMEQLKLRFPA